MANSRRSYRRPVRKTDLRIPLLLLFIAALVFFFIVMPKTTVGRQATEAASGHMSVQAGLVISEVMSDNASAYPDETGKFGDWVEIHNTTDEPISLKGVGLSDRSDRIIFLFPDALLNPDGYVTVFCDDMNQDNPRGVFHAKFKLSSLGDAVFLFDSTGVCIDSVAVPTLNGDEAYIRLEDGAWAKTDDFSPGFVNSAWGHDDYMAAYAIDPGVLMISEVCPAPRSGLRDEDDELSDWIELYNAGNRDIRLGNFALSDNESKPAKWAFPQDAVIKAKGYYIVFCSGKDKVEENTRYPHTNFSINNEEETILLSTLVGDLVDRVTVSGLSRDMSWGRDAETLEWRVMSLPTPGAPNDRTGASRTDQYLRALNQTGVYISEVMASASQIRAFLDRSPGDYVEIYNSSEQIVNLSGWGLSDNINWPHKWSFPQGAVIAPGEYKVILLDGYTGENTNGSRLRASFGIKRGGGEMMTLSDAAGRVLDRLYLPEIPTDISYGRTLGVNGFFYYNAPTPGAPNGSGFQGFSQRPVIELASGLYYGEVSVSMSAEKGAQIRYTTDGSIPTLENSTIYSKPVPVAESVVIRARAFQAGLQPSETATATYIMNTYHTLDVVSLVCDPQELWDPETGLLSEEQDHSTRNTKNPEEETVRKFKDEEKTKLQIPFLTPVYRTFGKDDRQGYVELLSQETKSAVISQGIKMDLMGDYSLDMPQKSFKLRAQAALGEKFFNAALFDSREYTFYKSFALRSSGNDNVWTRVADGVQTLLIDKYLDSPVLTLAWRPVVVYLNGQYWGHYNLRERKDRFSIAQFEGLDLNDKELLESITILRGSFSVVQGSNAEYRAMLKKFQALSPNTKAEDLQYIYDNIDVDNYIDWLAIKMYFGDSDPGNIMFYQVPGGKWKCLMFDLDYGLFDSRFNSPWSYLKDAGMGEQKINNVIFRKMLESNEIRELFFLRLGAIFQTLTTDVMIEQLDECIALIEPELPMHYAKWASHPDTKVLNSDSPTTADGYMRYWRTRVDRMKNVMNWRPWRFWGFVQEQFKLSDAEMIRYFGPRPKSPEDN